MISFDLKLETIMNCRRAFRLCTGRGLLITSALAVPIALQATDLLDAPGPGYRQFQSAPRYREDLLDAIPRPQFSKEKRIEAEIWESLRTGVRYYSAPSRSAPTGILLPLAGAQLHSAIEHRPFDKPIRLFGNAEAQKPTPVPALSLKK